MSKDREGLFIWEKWDRGISFSAEDFRGIFDPRLSADCRSNGYLGILKEWIALSSIEFWDEEIRDFSGRIEGDDPHHDYEFVSIEEMIPCDILGRPHYYADGNDYDIDHSDIEMTEEEFWEYAYS